MLRKTHDTWEAFLKAAETLESSTFCNVVGSGNEAHTRYAHACVRTIGGGTWTMQLGKEGKNGEIHTVTATGGYGIALSEVELLGHRFNDSPEDGQAGT